MNRDELAEKIAEHIGGSDPHPPYPNFWADKAQQVVDDAWPVLAEVWEEGAVTASGAPLNSSNPYK